MNLKLILAATALAAMTLSSCSSDTPVDATQNIARGETTWATFNLSLPTDDGSRASNGDPNAELTEQQIKTLHIYIFSNGILEIDEKITSGAAANKALGPVKLTTGEKVVYAVAGDLKVDGATYTATVEKTRLSDFEGILFNALADDIAKSGNFLMAGNAEVTIVKSTEADPCKVNVNVRRAATKTQLKYGDSKGNVTVRPTINADFSGAKFTMMQLAEKMWLTAGNYTPTGGESANGTYAGYTAVPETVADNMFCNAVNTFDGKVANSRYTGEAYNEHPVTGNTTFALVRLKAAPKSVCTGYDTATGTYDLTGSLGSDGTFYVLAKHDAETASYICAADKEYNILYFSDESVASNLITDAGFDESYEVFKYENGHTYYRVNLVTNPSAAADGPDKYCALRNHFYKISVTDIKALGAPNAPGVVPTDPDQPLESDAWLATTILIDPWTAVDMNNTTLQ